MRRVVLCGLLLALAPACETKHGCVGEAVACEDLDVEQCGRQSTCSSYGGTCSGQPAASCATAASEAACEALGGCTFSTACAGSARQCDSYTSQISCEDQDGCYWSSYSGCSGSASNCNWMSLSSCTSQEACAVVGACSGADSCSALDSLSCARRPGCTAQADCSGYVMACKYFDTAEECAQQAGCHWQ